MQNDPKNLVFCVLITAPFCCFKRKRKCTMPLHSRVSIFRSPPVSQCLHTHSITSLTPGTTLQHHPHQLLALPSCSLTRNFPISFSSPHSGTQAPTFTIRTNFF